MKRIIFSRFLLYICMVYLTGALYASPPKDYKEVNITKNIIYGVNQKLQRLPVAMKEQTRSIVWTLSKHSSGGRIKFQTNASQIYINANSKNISPSSNMNNIMKHGIDIYVNNEYNGSSYPSQDTSIKKISSSKKRNRTFLCKYTKGKGR